MDNGSEFGAHRRDENGNWDGKFKQHIVNLGIKPILARVKHPPTSGKLEKWFDTYCGFRKSVSSFDEFVDWYNNRPHGSLNFEVLETSEPYSELRSDLMAEPMLFPAIFEVTGSSPFFYFQLLSLEWITIDLFSPC